MKKEKIKIKDFISGKLKLGIREQEKYGNQPNLIVLSPNDALELFKFLGVKPLYYPSLDTMESVYSGVDYLGCQVWTNWTIEQGRAYFLRVGL